MEDDVLRQIYDLVRTERWYAQKHLTPTRLAIRDSLRFETAGGDAHRWLLLSVEPETRTYSVVIVEDDAGTLRLAAPTALLEAIREGLALPTERGGVLRYSGPHQHEALAYRPLEAGNSSNSIFVTTLGNRQCVAKFYRKTDGTGASEQQTLAAMQATGITPGLVGAVTYQPPAGATQPAATVLCLYLEMIAGSPAYEPFQHAVRAALALLQDGVPAQALLDDDRHVLPDLCTELGRGIARFHTAAQSLLAPSAQREPLILAAFLHKLRGRWQQLNAVKGQSGAGTSLPDFGTLKLNELLVALAADAAVRPNDLAACYSHGDLHLSHLIMEQDSLRCRIIDPAHGLAESAAQDHSARDLFQICRGFECFIFDEVATWLAAMTKCDREAAAQRLVTAGDPEAVRFFEFAAAWSDRVFASVLQACLENMPDRSGNPIGDPRWRAAFYLDRLLHELEYNVAYGRCFFLHGDFAFLQAFLGKSDLRLTSTQSAKHPATKEIHDVIH